jgi:hypothetical protein
MLATYMQQQQQQLRPSTEIEEEEEEEEEERSEMEIASKEEQIRGDMQMAASALEEEEDRFHTLDMTDENWDFTMPIHESLHPPERNPMNPPMLPPPLGVVAAAEANIAKPRNKPRPKRTARKLKVITDAATGVQSMIIPNPKDCVPIFVCPLQECEEKPKKQITGYRGIRKHFKDRHNNIQLINENRKHPSNDQLATRLVRLLTPQKYDAVLNNVIAYALDLVQHD